jgi:protocatechuate 3,4-dioxygenase, beta subunit
MRKYRQISRREVLGAGAALPFGVLAATAEAAAKCSATPRQTSGPFYPFFEQTDKDVDLTRMVGHDETAAGEVIRVTGRVLDADCKPVEGALVDLWQADHNGRYRHPADPNPAAQDPNFQGWGQTVTDAEGRYSFRTIKPAPYPLAFLEGAPDESAGFRTRHIHFRVSKRGHVEFTTQMYFAGEELNDADALLSRVPAAERHKIVIAPGKAAAGEVPVFQFDMVVAKA